MSMFDLEEREAIESAARAWWLFLLTGLLWLLFAIIVLRFDYTTVTAVSILFGVVAIFAGVNEFFMLAASHRWWKVLHGLLGVIFVVVGIIAFVHPGGTFEAPGTSTLTATPRFPAARMRSSMSGSVKYGLRMSSRCCDCSITSPMACVPGWNPPGTFCSSVAGIVPGASGAGK